MKLVVIVFHESVVNSFMGFLTPYIGEMLFGTIFPLLISKIKVVLSFQKHYKSLKMNIMLVGPYFIKNVAHKLFCLRLIYALNK